MGEMGENYNEIQVMRKNEAILHYLRFTTLQVRFNLYSVLEI